MRLTTGGHTRILTSECTSNITKALLRDTVMALAHPREETGESVEDEFACPGTVQGKLLSVRPLVERVFGVSLQIGGEGDGQIWLKMKGRRREVEEAKVFVKGQVNEAEMRDVLYPEVLHAVFCGAGRLFMHSLMKYTCARIQVRSPGTLLISGLEEPVVRACSLVLDLVEKYEGSHGWRAEAGAGPAGESLDSRRAFKSLVEKWDDRHTLDLLVLPVRVKEALLSLVTESGLDPAIRETESKREEEREREGGSETEREDGERERNKEGERERFLAEGSSQTQAVGEEFRLILRFFTAMGYNTGVVMRVLSRTGPREPSQILDLPPSASATIVTGEQRFHEVLQTPFDLKLTNDPGDPDLRQVIIDGSNVAMSHGLGQFFSCREWLWLSSTSGTEVIAGSPQQHYMTELQNLGLLSFTPSRDVLGKRINSYDDRFMLQLASQTDGVIVTNDNLRDLLDESPAFKDVIKKRLLQYTFVGDLFMVPDDPLGRTGPHLSDFLRSTPRSLALRRAHTEQAEGWPRPGRSAAESSGLRGAAESCSLREQLSQVFPGEDSLVTLAIQCNPDNHDINTLSHIILNLQRERAGER
ncbi:hypothetical protein AAFF_G00365060 [Aldrovandia affinis]|uniref:RNase NYN domain-containing protein n=1 Tax=Aldrovandia affinis TaxID=143900 RepID=A0AAD7R4T2_9TELE|nr:hypothetical protein AAFF_G00365060 [Aldrovandia affinis]